MAWTGLFQVLNFVLLLGLIYCGGKFFKKILNALDDIREIKIILKEIKNKIS